MLKYRIDQNFEVRYSYPVCFTQQAFSPSNPLLAQLMTNEDGSRARVLVVVDAGLVAAQAQLLTEIDAYLRAHADRLDAVRAPWLVRGGEIVKNDLLEVEQFYRLASDLGLCRHSYVLVLGGGAVLDAIGYATATAHRGLRLIRMPSTVLGQNDAGVGVKNAINWQGRKNFLGTFVPPFAIVNDLDLLTSGAPEDRRAGIAEAVKVALIRDADYFERLHRQRHALAALETQAMNSMVIRCAQLHLAQIRGCGDPFERGSARPLDFGHWSAHKLEEISVHRLRHGEAVAIGIALDCLYSHRIGMLSEAALGVIFETLRDIGFALRDEALARLDVARALGDFREHLGGSLSITLLAAIGNGVEVHAIDVPAMRACIGELMSMRHPPRRIRQLEAVP